jgi:DNA invertase Pin-like site-specific DNA recombinase
MPTTYPDSMHKKVFPLLKENLGSVKKTCKALGINKTTFYEWLEKDDDLKGKINAIAKIRKDVFLDLLSHSYGILSTACRALDVSRVTVYSWMEQDPQFKREVDEIREFSKDFVEQKMFEGIKDGNTQLITFYLSRIARDRGYIEKTEMEHTFTGKTLRVGFDNEPEEG